MEAKTFGAFIAKIRKENKMTQVDLAKKIYVTDKAISRWERGLGFPDIKTIEPLANALNLSVLEIMKSERLEKEHISNDNAAKVITDTFTLACKQQKEEKNFQLVIAICMCSFVLIGFFINNISIFRSFLFLISFFVMMASCRYWYQNRNDNISRQIYGMIIVVSLIIMFCTCQFLIPDFMINQYTNIMILIILAIIFIMSIYQFIRLITKKSLTKRKHILASIFLISVMAVTLIFIEKNTYSILNSDIDKKANVALQYARLHIVQDCQIDEKWINGEFSSYIKDDIPDYYYIAFSYRIPNSDIDMSYG